MEDVTQKLLDDLKYAPGDFARAARQAKAPKQITPALLLTLSLLMHPQLDVTMGFMSNALLYSRFFSGMRRTDHMNIIRLLKGGFLMVVRHAGTPPQETNARRDIPYGDQAWYEIGINPEKVIS